MYEIPFIYSQFYEFWKHGQFDAYIVPKLLVEKYQNMTKFHNLGTGSF